MGTRWKTIGAWLMLAAAAGAEGPLAGPAGELAAALADLEGSVPPGRQGQTRYLTLYALPAEEWLEAEAAVSLVLNSLSRADTIARPEQVSGSGGRLLRLSLDDYGLPHDGWEAVAADDPYWHLRTIVLAGPADAGTVEVFTDGGWVGLERAARLRALSASAGAVLRADHFLAKVSTTLDGGLYYRLAGVERRERDFLAALGIDLDVIARLRADEGANLIRSQVTFKMRRVVRRGGPLGDAWHTYDVATSTPERDPIRNPLAFEYDASEHIAARRNGLHVYALYDRQGVRQDSVPDGVAKDTSDPHGAGIIAPMLSCVRCHVEDGLRPVANDQRRLLSGPVALYAERPRVAQRLAGFYGADLDLRLVRAREDLAAAVRAATGGGEWRQSVAALARIYERYVDALVSPQQAARELGIEPSAVGGVMAASHDAALLCLSQGIPIQRKQWESAFAEAAVLAAAVGQETRNAE